MAVRRFPDGPIIDPATNRLSFDWWTFLHDFSEELKALLVEFAALAATVNRGGVPGRDGDDGADSFIPGPPGLQGIPGIPGPRGFDGEDGNDGYIVGPLVEMFTWTPTLNSFTIVNGTGGITATAYGTKI